MKTTDYPKQVSGETVMKFNTKIILLGTLFIMSLHNKILAAENTAAIENLVTTSEIITRYWNARFPYGPYARGPIECKIESSEKVCRKDEKPITSYTYKTLSSNGWGTSIKDIKKDGPCIIIYYRLSVDNIGNEGRTCLTPYADLQIRIELNNY
ncbi:hypothetical protein [Klebsiella variicola]|uniref:hypothetical protein n=1 Tax=Klebsiella variicola TaxID=244366 RepID=UPI001CF6D1F2|nr:hypothetical protein [Klebsiella variicola]MCB3523551.1 hypothetical protein [Klebsiella variicola]